MGVPGFFGWVKRSYPKCVRAFVESSTAKTKGSESDSDSESDVPIEDEENQYGADANPNHVEFDNFYLDMNGLIHACSHGDMYMNQPQNEEEIMLRIGIAINRLMDAVRPRNLVYMAIDGVAPRAKMNQQRSRRFISAKRQQLSKAHQMATDSDTNKYEFDSNAVTPGTQFMHNVGKFLRRFVTQELDSNPRWKGLKVFLSDASVPGEGEHKIMDFVRKQRLQPGYNPNLTHILYGQDADLIFLGLGTHEVGFYILRDVMAIICKQCRRAGHNESACFMYAAKEDKPSVPGVPAEWVPLELVELPLFRQYLFRQFQTAKVQLDLEAVIDDFIMLCVFLGNDFLPSLPTLRINEDGLDLIIKLYRLLYMNQHTPLYVQGNIRWENLFYFLDEIAKYESKILQIRYSKRNKPKQQEVTEPVARTFVAASDPSKIEIDAELGSELDLKDPNAIDLDSELQNDNSLSDPNKIDIEKEILEIQSELAEGAEEDEGAAPNLNEEIQTLGSQITTDKISENLLHKILSGDLFEDVMVKRQIESSLLSEIGYPDENWRENYHKLKFGSASLEKVALEHLVGVRWVMDYYLKGCPAWGWYYPFHHSVFAQDLLQCAPHAIEKLWLDYTQTDSGPFEPFQQLLGVLPLQSSKLLPPCFAELMKSPEFESWYPINFAIDIEQKREGIALLPFIDAVTLQKGSASMASLLSSEDVIRNSRKNTIVFVSSEDVCFNSFVALYIVQAQADLILCNEQHGVTGAVKRVEEISFAEDSPAVAVYYANPPFPENFKYKAKLLPGAKVSMRDITKDDLLKKKKSLPRPGIGATLYMQPEYAIASFWPKIESSNVGYRMLEKMGWNGGALGKNQEGIMEPINHSDMTEDKELPSLMDVVDFELAEVRKVTKLKPVQSADKKRNSRVARSFSRKFIDNMTRYCALHGLPSITVSCLGLTNEQRKLVHGNARKFKTATFTTHSTGPKSNRMLHVTCSISPEESQKLLATLQHLSPEEQEELTELDGQAIVEAEMQKDEQAPANPKITPGNQPPKFDFTYTEQQNSAPVCKHFARGKCWKGRNCNFLHSSAEENSKTDPRQRRGNNNNKAPTYPQNNNNNNNNSNQDANSVGLPVAEGIELFSSSTSERKNERQERSRNPPQNKPRPERKPQKTDADWRLKKNQQDQNSNNEVSSHNQGKRRDQPPYQETNYPPEKQNEDTMQVEELHAATTDSPKPQRPDRRENPAKDSDWRPDCALHLLLGAARHSKEEIEKTLTQYGVGFSKVFFKARWWAVLVFATPLDLQKALLKVQEPLDALNIRWKFGDYKPSKQDRFPNEAPPQPVKRSSSVSTDMQALRLRDSPPLRNSAEFNEIEPDSRNSPSPDIPQDTDQTGPKKMRPTSFQKNRNQQQHKPRKGPQHSHRQVQQYPQQPYYHQPVPQANSTEYVMQLQQSLQTQIPPQGMYVLPQGQYYMQYPQQYMQYGMPPNQRM